MTPPHAPSGNAGLRVRIGRLLSTPGGKRRALLYEELASLLQAGIGLREAIGSLADRGATKERPLLRIWHAQVERGDPLHDGMASHPEVFSQVETTMVRVGERSGHMVDTLRRLATRLENAHAARLQVIGAVSYPVIVLHVALFLPSLPLVAMTMGFGAYMAVVLVGLLAIWGIPLLLAALYLARRDDPAFSRRVLRLPLVGKALHAAAVERFAWTLGALHGAGETSDFALEEAALAADAGWFRLRLQGAVERIREGEPLAEAVTWLEAVPREVREMISTGERSGSLTETMGRAATLFEERRARATKTAAAAIGALLFGTAVVVTVILVLAVFMRVYGPILDM